MRRLKTLTMILSILMLMASGLSQTMAAEKISVGTFTLSVSGEEVTLKANEAKVSDVLEDLAEQSNLQVKLMGPIETVITDSFEKMPMEEALGRILASSNWASLIEETKDAKGVVNKSLSVFPKSTLTDLSQDKQNIIGPNVASASTIVKNSAAADGDTTVNSAKDKSLQFRHIDKISSSLISIANKLNEAGITPENSEKLGAENFGNPLAKVNNKGEIHLVAKLNILDELTIQELKRVGLNIERISEPLMSIRGWAQPEKLDDIAGLDAVIRIRHPDYGITRIGTVNSEGDTALRADLVRDSLSLRNDGEGIAIGVISDGVNSISIPQGTNPADLPDVTVNPSSGGSGDEGTAMLEIIHDLAPGSTLGFSATDGPMGFIDSLTWLKDTFNADIIVDDIGFMTEPYFEDGDVAIAARSIVQDGVVFVSASGNDTGKHWEGDFAPINVGVDPDIRVLHDWQGGDWSNDVALSDNQSITVFMQWNEEFGNSTENYDLLLYANDEVTLLEEGNDNQNGNDNPYEVLFHRNSSGALENVKIAVERLTGVDNRRVELFIYVRDHNTPRAVTSSPEYLEAEGSIYGHPAIVEAIDVAAIDQSDFALDDVENFSSHGPSRIDFPVLEVREKPFISGIDGVSITGAGGFSNPFYGTSAAAPHLAAIAGLMLSVNPDLEVSQLKGALSSTANDIEVAGFDRLSGHGRADALDAVEDVIIKNHTSGAYRLRNISTMDWTESPQNVDHGDSLSLENITLIDSQKDEIDRVIAAWLVLDIEDLRDSHTVTIETQAGNILSHIPATGNNLRRKVLVSIPPNVVVAQNNLVINHNGLFGDIIVHEAALRLMFIPVNSETDELVTGGFRFPNGLAGSVVGWGWTYASSDPMHIVWNPDANNNNETQILREVAGFSQYDIDELRAARLFITGKGISSGEVTLKVNNVIIGTLPMVTNDDESIRTRYISIPPNLLSVFETDGDNSFSLEGTDFNIFGWGLAIDYQKKDNDQDNDDMDDDWETANGLDPTNPDDAGIDSDGDGLTNLEEFLAGTNPQDSDTDRDGYVDSLDLLPNSLTVRTMPDGDTDEKAYTWVGNQLNIWGNVRALTGKTYTYEWDVNGDGTPECEGSVTDTRNISCTQSYSQAGLFEGKLSVTDNDGRTGESVVRIRVLPTATKEAQIQLAIERGLKWLYLKQNSSGQIYSYNYNSSWGAETSAAVLAFENRDHKPCTIDQDGDGDIDAIDRLIWENTRVYAETVHLGLDAAISSLAARSVNTIYDSNANSVYVADNYYSYSSYRGPYKIGMYMMALVGAGDINSGAPELVATTGPSGVIGKTYRELVEDMVDYSDYAQYHSTYGGWRYGPGQWPDNSACQWPAIGMEAAEFGWDVPVRQEIKDLNANWTTYSQYFTGYENHQYYGAFGYTGKGTGAARTGAGMCQLSFQGNVKDDPRIQAAAERIGRYDKGSTMYDMYAIAKAARIAKIDTNNDDIGDAYTEIQLLGGWDWYEAYGDRLLSTQRSDGSWYAGSWPGQVLETAWGAEILTKNVFTLRPIADLQVTPNPTPAMTAVVFDLSRSFHQDSSKLLDRWEIDVEGDGTSDIFGNFPTTVATLYDGYDDLGNDYSTTANLLVFDNVGDVGMDQVNVTITSGNVAPVADPGGPYNGNIGEDITFDGSNSYDPNEGTGLPGDHIVSWNWDLDGDGQYDDATGKVVQWSWNIPYQGYVGLKVEDDAGLSSTSQTQADYTEIFVVDLWPVADSYVTLSASRVSRYAYQYEYEFSLINRGNAIARNVECTLETYPNQMIVVDGDVSFGDIIGGETKVSLNSFIYQIDRRYPMTDDQIKWRLEYDDATGHHVRFLDLPLR